MLFTILPQSSAFRWFSLFCLSCSFGIITSQGSDTPLCFMKFSGINLLLPCIFFFYTFNHFALGWSSFESFHITLAKGAWYLYYEKNLMEERKKMKTQNSGIGKQILIWGIIFTDFCETGMGSITFWRAIVFLIFIISFFLYPIWLIFFSYFLFFN